MRVVVLVEIEDKGLALDTVDSSNKIVLDGGVREARFGHEGFDASDNLDAKAMLGLFQSFWVMWIDAVLGVRVEAGDVGQRSVINLRTCIISGGEVVVK